MFKKMLLALDFSKPTNELIECIGELMKVGLQEMVLAHVVDLPSSDSSAKATEGFEEEIRIVLQKIKELKLSVAVHSTSGVLTEDITRIAEVEKVDIIIIGAIEQKALHKILIPLDFSANNQIIIDYIKKLAGVVDEVILTHVVDQGLTEEDFEKVQPEIQRRLDHLAADLAAMWINVRTTIELGKVSNEVNRLAEERGVSLIALSSRGIGQAKETLLGSTAKAIIKESKKPVLLFPYKSLKI